MISTKNHCFLLDRTKRSYYLDRTPRWYYLVLDRTISDHLAVAKLFFDIKQSLQAGTESIMKQRYKSHNLYVKSEVPEEDLLIWNVKEGWEPLCKFLGKPIPDVPFPHANKTGDMEYIDKYAHKSDFFQRIGR